MHTLSATEQRDVLRLLWPQHVDSAEQHADTLRWYQQGFVLQTMDADFPLGLVQGHGGPCGVLAAVQAELLRLFLFEYHQVQHRNAAVTTTATTATDARTTLQELLTSVRSAGESGRRALLAEALASVLVRCSTCPRAHDASTTTQPSQTHSVHVVVCDAATASTSYNEVVVSVTNRRDPALLRVVHEHLDAFASPLGVMNFVFSAIRTRSVATIRNDSDDADHLALTAQFGHCSQELLNLLLTGAAVSNVFDGAVPMGDSGLVLHGVPARATIGYLTQLEALRYCQVGSYYKSPLVPVWVIASTSHFSVCFALNARVSSETTSTLLLERVQRVFKSFDPMETGFMEINNLTESLKQLGVAADVVANEYWMARLFATLEVAGAGIVLWDAYWRVVSVLLHTGDLELALQGDYQQQTDAGVKRPRSDSDVARELQAQFDAESSSGNGNAAPVAAAAAAPVAVPAPVDESFDLFYYNGLGSADADAGDRQRRPQLATCRVTIPARIDFIGASVPMFETGTSGGYGCAPLDEILKTKWPRARIDWHNEAVPTID